MIFDWQFNDILPTVERYTTDSWPTATKIWLILNKDVFMKILISIDTWLIVGCNIDRLSTDYQPTIGWLSVTIDRVTTDCQPSINPYISWLLTNSQSNILIETIGAHSKYDPESVVSGSDTQMIYTWAGLFQRWLTLTEALFVLV